MKIERIQELKQLANACPDRCQPPQCVVENYAALLLECLAEIERLQDPNFIYEKVIKRGEELLGKNNSDCEPPVFDAPIIALRKPCWPQGEYPYDKP